MIYRCCLNLPGVLVKLLGPSLSLIDLVYSFAKLLSMSSSVYISRMILTLPVSTVVLGTIRFQCSISVLSGRERWSYITGLIILSVMVLISTLDKSSKEGIVFFFRTQYTSMKILVAAKDTERMSRNSSKRWFMSS